MNNIIATSHLSKSFKAKQAVADVSLAVNEGDIYGLIGENGAGKTTFMRMLCGLASPTSGTISLFGSPDLERGRRMMGCTIESPALYPLLSGRENLEVYRLLFGIRDKTLPDTLLSLVGLGSDEKKKAKDYSLGMKQRLMIAIALIGDPKLLILDEPMNGLDPLGIKEIRDLLLYLNKEKKITIVISSHILEELSKIATCYGVIQQGKLIEEFAAAELEKSGRKFLEISVDDTNAALDLLKRNGFSGGDVVGGDNHIELAGHFDEGAEIIDLLVRKGIRVNYLARKEDSLEGYFMNLIGGNKQ